MSKEYENSLIKVFEHLDTNNFYVNLQPNKLFLCGGKVDIKETIPPSFRDRLLGYTAETDMELHDSFVLAEAFKDYFKDNYYTDLLAFENDIAYISTLVIIFLESAGSLVELGLFCNKPEIYNKLLIIAPQKEIEGEDSFIYLGPIEYIRKKNTTSIEIMPWPSKDILEYDKDNLSELCASINAKINTQSKVEMFKQENSGHIAHLICAIVTMSYPILLSEIELVLYSLDIDTTQSRIARLLYLLQKIDLIKTFKRSHYTYYYPVDNKVKKIKFGMTKNNVRLDERNARVSILQSFSSAQNEPSIKRKNALKQIIALHKGSKP